MLNMGLKARVTCTVCKTSREIDLEALVAKVGDDYTLFNKRTRCKLTPGCRGWNRFLHANSGGMGMWDAAQENRWVAADWQANLRGDAEMRAALQRGGLGPA